MRKRSKSQPHELSGSRPPSLATVLAALDTAAGLSESRRRDLRSGVRRVAELIGNVPAAIPLSMQEIQTALSEVKPIAAGVTPKRFTNIRSDFVAAVRASAVIPLKAAKKGLSPDWTKLFSRLSGRQAHLGLSRLAHYASAHEITPGGINDEVIDVFIKSVREGSLHRKPNALHRQVALIWNKAAVDRALGLKPVAVPSFRGPPRRIDLSLLLASFIEDGDRYLAWCTVSDPFAADARDRPLAPRTLKLTRDQLHAAVSALVKSGTKPDKIRSLADLVTVENYKSILRRRVTEAGGPNKSFDHYLARALVRIAREWVKVDADVLAQLKKAASKLPAPSRFDLTPKNKRFLGQFEDPETLRRLQALPTQLWNEVKSEFERQTELPRFGKGAGGIRDWTSDLHAGATGKSLRTGVRHPHLPATRTWSDLYARA